MMYILFYSYTVYKLEDTPQSRYVQYKVYAYRIKILDLEPLAWHDHVVKERVQLSLCLQVIPNI